MQSSCSVGGRHRNNYLSTSTLAGTRIDYQTPSQQRETLANAEKPKSSSLRPWQVQLIRNKAFALVFDADYKRGLFSGYVHMRLFDARMLYDVNQKLPHGLKSHDSRIVAQWKGLLSTLDVARKVIALLHVLSEPL